MSYSVKKNEQFEVYEITNDLVVFKHDNEKDARTICRKLNLGSGFNGWTPQFFSKNFSVDI